MLNGSFAIISAFDGVGGVSTKVRGVFGTVSGISGRGNSGTAFVRCGSTVSRRMVVRANGLLSLAGASAGGLRDVPCSSMFTFCSRTISGFLNVRIPDIRGVRRQVGGIARRVSRPRRRRGGNRSPGSDRRSWFKVWEVSLEVLVA